MSILKALQKKHTESLGGETAAHENIVPFNRSVRRTNVPPDLLGDGITDR